MMILPSSHNWNQPLWEIYLRERWTPTQLKFLQCVWFYFTALYLFNINYIGQKSYRAHFACSVQQGHLPAAEAMLITITCLPLNTLEVSPSDASLRGTDMNAACCRRLGGHGNHPQSAEARQQWAGSSYRQPQWWRQQGAQTGGQ